ncbi:MAG: hypothetical protein ACRDH9_02965 [Actinomycetota bacterium]
MSGASVLQAALAGPVVAGIAWLALVRLPLLRRSVAGALALGANAAAWTLFWFIYRGDIVVWRSFQPELLGATILAIAEIPLILAALRADPIPDGGNAPTIAGLAVSASAIAAISYAGSLAVVALALAVPTIAASSAALSGKGRSAARGLIGLAAADAIALVGLSLVYARTGSIFVGPAGGIGPGLILVAALIKGGAIPGLATWRLSATEGPGAWLDVALRGQAVALAAIAALEMSGSATSSSLAIAAAVAIAACAVSSLFSRSAGSSLAGVSGAGIGVCFFALGLAGAVGSRAFLLLFPAFLLASGLVTFLGRANVIERGEKGGAGPWGWLAAGALGVGLASLLGLPPGGGFPGTWLTLSLAVSRSEAALGWLLAAGVVGAGVTVAMAGSIPLLVAVRARAWQATTGSVIAIALLYLGTQPIRIAIGWWVRVETQLALPEVLPTAGAPGLPAIGGLRLLLSLAPALLLVGAAIAIGRGWRDVSPAFAPTTSAGQKRPARFQRLNKALSSVATTVRPLKEYAARARALGAGFGIAAVLELAALLMVGRIVLLSARAGFL